MPEVITTPALVLRWIRWSESSKIVTLFTREQGLLKVIAKGALRPRSPFRGVLETLNLVEVVLSLKAQRGLQVVTNAALLDGFLDLKEDLSRVGQGYAVLELLQQTFHLAEAVPDFFDYLVQLLHRLQVVESGATGMVFYHFLLRLSRELGFGWQMERCLGCGKTPESFPVYLNAERGGVLCSRCRSAGSPVGPALERREWEVISRLARLPLDAVTGGGQPLSPGRQKEILQIFVRHLALHTEREIELKSLNWYP